MLKNFRFFAKIKGRQIQTIAFRLIHPVPVEEVNEGRFLRFYMTTEEDFQQFKQCIVSELAQVEFISADSLEDIPQQD